jgi:hypothetical protein
MAAATVVLRMLMLTLCLASARVEFGQKEGVRTPLADAALLDAVLLATLSVTDPAARFLEAYAAVEAEFLLGEQDEAFTELGLEYWKQVLDATHDRNTLTRCIPTPQGMHRHPRHRMAGAVHRIATHAWRPTEQLARSSDHNERAPPAPHRAVRNRR